MFKTLSSGAVKDLNGNKAVKDLNGGKTVKGLNGNQTVKTFNKKNKKNMYDFVTNEKYGHIIK